MSNAFIDPKILSGIKSLPLLAKTVIDGFMSGSNKSILRGEGIEFSQYRSYQPGDDLRSLDWKMFARSDRYYIRESQVEASVNVRFILDASASMGHTDDGLKKIDYAKFIIASLAYLAYLQGDAVGMSIAQEPRPLRMEPGQSFQHLNNLWHQLENCNPAGTITGEGGHAGLFSGNQKKELIILLTDFYESGGALTSLVDVCRRRKNEVLVFHLLGKNEMTFSYPDNASLEDLETGKQVQVNRAAMQKNYGANLNTFLTSTRSALLSRQVAYHLFTMDQPLELAIKEFLLMRKRL